MNKDEIILHLTRTLIVTRSTLLQCHHRMSLNELWGPEIDYTDRTIEKIDQTFKLIGPYLIRDEDFINTLENDSTLSHEA